MRGNNRNRENTVESRNDFERLKEIIFIKQEQVIEALTLYNEACLKVENEKYD